MARQDQRRHDRCELRAGVPKANDAITVGSNDRIRSCDSSEWASKLEKFITEAVRRDSYPDFNGKRPGPSITLSTIFKCTAVNVPLRCCISSTMRARHSLSQVSAALFFVLSFSAALRNCLSHFARRMRTPSRTRFECLPSSARTSLRNASMRLSIVSPP